MTDSTAVLLILDRSGSMDSIRRDVEKGLSEMVAEQVALPGTVTFDQVSFASSVTYDTKQAGKEYVARIRPDGQTALYDAIVQGTQLFRKDLVARGQNPDFVQVVVATDGQENASKHADALLVRDTISYYTDTEGWDFTFLGSDPASIANAAKIGFEGKKTMQFNNSASGVAGMTTGLSAYIAQTRSGKDAGYDDAHRKASVK
jgi:hypothetical protein